MAPYYSQLHFSHHKVLKNKDRLRELQADKLNLSEKGVHTLCRCQQGLSVMLENKPGVHKVYKLMGILIMEE